MNNTNKRTLIAAIAAVLLLALGAVAGYAVQRANSNSTPTAAGSVSTVANRASASDHNAADVMFVQRMIPHHEQALQMARLADTRASSPKVKQLAATIEAAQQPEIDKMKGWLVQWGADSSSMMSMGHDMGGMMSDADMKSLTQAQGAQFDKQFLSMMTGHHDGAIKMGNDELQNGKNADALALASSIVITQQAEVNDMQRLQQ